MLGDLGKLIVAKDFKKLPKVQKIARSGHTARNALHVNVPGLALKYWQIFMNILAKEGNSS